MTNQHPLTDEICFDISEAAFEEFYSEPFDWWDAPEESFSEDVLMNMRAAADWQLEQVIDWLNATIFKQSMWPHDIENVPKELKKAMRPQQLEDN